MPSASTGVLEGFDVSQILISFAALFEIDSSGQLKLGGWIAMESQILVIDDHFAWFCLLMCTFGENNI